MKQMTLSAGGFDRYTKQTRRAAFLAEVGCVVPWKVRPINGKYAGMAGEMHQRCGCFLPISVFAAECGLVAFIFGYLFRPSLASYVECG